jgi:hypothetical protein
MALSYVVTVGRIGPAAEGSVPALIELAEEGLSAFRAEDEMAGEDGMEDFEKTLERLRKMALASRAIVSLGQIGRPAHLVLPVLDKAAGSHNELFQIAAHRAIQHMEKDDEGQKPRAD